MWRKGNDVEPAALVPAVAPWPASDQPGDDLEPRPRIGRHDRFFVPFFPESASMAPPDTSPEAGAPLRRTPLYDCHRELGARMVGFAGWEMPVQYTGVIEEHRAVRGAAGLFDVSHMGEVRVRGAGAESFLQGLTPNDVAQLLPGRAHYSGLLTERGP